MAKALRDELPKLRRREHLGAGLARVTRDCCLGAAALAGPEPDETAIHCARKLLKRAKALLRLAQNLDIPGAKSTRRRTAVLGRQLAPRRDAAVARQVAERYARKTTRRLVADAARFAVRRLDTKRSAPQWSDWRNRLAAVASNAERLSWGEPAAADVMEALCDSVRRTIRRARVAAGGDIAVAHEWRKATTVLREQLLALRPIFPCDVAQAGRRLQALTRRLGHALDDAVLLKALARIRWPARRNDGRERLERAICRHQKKQLKRARRHWSKLKTALRRMVESIAV
jgi:hypothetical protein